MFIIDFRLGTTAVNAYSGAVTAGRMYIEFPTLSSASVA